MQFEHKKMSSILVLDDGRKIFAEYIPPKYMKDYPTVNIFEISVQYQKKHIGFLRLSNYAVTPTKVWFYVMDYLIQHGIIDKPVLTNDHTISITYKKINDGINVFVDTPWIY